MCPRNSSGFENASVRHRAYGKLRVVVGRFLKKNAVQPLVESFRARRAAVYADECWRLRGIDNDADRQVSEKRLHRYVRESELRITRRRMETLEETQLVARRFVGWLISQRDVISV